MKLAIAFVLAAACTAASRQRNVEGRVVEARGNQLVLRTERQGLMQLDLTDSTSLRFDGRDVALEQIRAGSNVRASYQMVGGTPEALTITVTSTRQQQPGLENLQSQPPGPTPSPMR